MGDKKYTAYVGTYTSGESKGIYRFTLNENKGIIENIRLSAELSNPTYVAINKNNTNLYSVIKIGERGGIASFKIDSNYNLEPLNCKFTDGKSPCHVVLDESNEYVFTSNYHKAELICYNVSSDGSIKNSLATILHKGSGPNKLRQDSAHIHFSTFTPDKKYLCVVDLGLDKLFVYSLKGDKLEELTEKNINFKPGSGPRHLTFHPNGNFAYIITELSSEVITLKYNSASGSFEVLQYISALPKGFTLESGGGAIHISHDGNFLYVSNRSNDNSSITVFTVDSLSGKLALSSNNMLKGQGPRDFSISPSGKFLVAANQNTNNVELYSINSSTGALTYLDVSEYIPNPVCIKFLN
ncbi:6-phosphogluconolactonase [Clostridium acidisoli DSM 12555]|uniref:6-phosphogluconolactonase n=1 Tax=Clostridium acidisoli DSM 12555 TaxID=1121291 RepID=A0A1W1XVX7_9CLOT|nr:lactonase family protein [Clostridium acidisoli]SMC27678.1 6-phosphogluconolactonase [Clostridium acidisoli DSM 12555]